MIMRSKGGGGLRDIVCTCTGISKQSNETFIWISIVSSQEAELQSWGGRYNVYINLWMIIWIPMIFFPGAGLQPWGGGAPEVHQGRGPDPQLHDAEDPGDPQKGGRWVHGMSGRSGQCPNIPQCFMIEVFW